MQQYCPDCGMPPIASGAAGVPEAVLELDCSLTLQCCCCSGVDKALQDVVPDLPGFAVQHLLAFLKVSLTGDEEHKVCWGQSESLMAIEGVLPCCHTDEQCGHQEGHI